MVTHLVAEVVEYEDTTDEDYQPVTLYLVRVSYTGDIKISYTLRKRYSEFNKLYVNIRPKFAKLQEFKFPHKSMFNTQALFTKQRRQEGFDHLVKLLCECMPESEISAFFELERHIFESKKNIAKLQNVPVNKSSFVKNHSADDLASSNSSTGITDSSIRPRMKSKDVQRSVNELNTDSSSVSSLSKLFIFNVLPSSTAVVVALFLFLHSMGWIDSQSASSNKIYLTISIVSCSFAFTRIAVVKLFGISY